MILISWYDDGRNIKRGATNIALYSNSVTSGAMQNALIYVAAENARAPRNARYQVHVVPHAWSLSAAKQWVYEKRIADASARQHAHARATGARVVVFDQGA
jgi:hypothetical protein